MEMFEGIHPIHRIGWDQNNPPYYAFNKEILGYDRVIEHTCLSDTGFYSKKMVREMVSILGYTISSFIEKTYKIINKKCYPSEPDLYFNWVVKKFPQLYKFKRIKTKMDAKEGKDPFAQLWDKHAIIRKIEAMKDTNYDTYSIHSWVDNSHNKWR